MRIKMTAAATALALAVSTMIAVSPASAQRYHHGGYHGYHGGYRHGYYGGDAAFAGFAAGALLGGALAAQRPYYGGNSVGYCESRFRSYDPGSGTYLGYDGRRHSCP